MADDFLLTRDDETSPLPAELVGYADQLEMLAIAMLRVLAHDVPVLALRPEEVDAMRRAAGAAHGAGRDVRLIATAAHGRISGRRS